MDINNCAKKYFKLPYASFFFDRRNNFFSCLSPFLLTVGTPLEHRWNTLFDRLNNTVETSFYIVEKTTFFPLKNRWNTFFLTVQKSRGFLGERIFSWLFVKHRWNIFFFTVEITFFSLLKNRWNCFYFYSQNKLLLMVWQRNSLSIYIKLSPFFNFCFCLLCCIPPVLLWIQCLS